MHASFGTTWRWTSLALLVALVPLELGGLTATENVLVACDDHDEVSATQVESPCPTGLDLLEIEDDEGVSEIRQSETFTVTVTSVSGFESPLVVHLDDLERPPRA